MKWFVSNFIKREKCRHAGDLKDMWWDERTKKLSYPHLSLACVLFTLLYLAKIKDHSQSISLNQYHKLGLKKNESQPASHRPSKSHKRKASNTTFIHQWHQDTKNLKQPREKVTTINAIITWKKKNIILISCFFSFMKVIVLCKKSISGSNKWESFEPWIN